MAQQGPQRESPDRDVPSPLAIRCVSAAAPWLLLVALIWPDALIGKAAGFLTLIGGALAIALYYDSYGDALPQSPLAVASFGSRTRLHYWIFFLPERGAPRKEKIILLMTLLGLGALIVAPLIRLVRVV